jgi:hypothetical protein
MTSTDPETANSTYPIPRCTQKGWSKNGVLPPKWVCLIDTTPEENATKTLSRFVVKSTKLISAVLSCNDRVIPRPRPMAEVGYCVSYGHGQDNHGWCGA